jgi:phosphoglycolate phosphatase-like HAD superfamily hydrolase
VKQYVRLAGKQVAEKSSATKPLLEFQPKHDFLICFDMDGHLLDSMTAKQVLVFHPVFMDKFDLRSIESFYRLHAENHNLWTEDRGCDRHAAKSFTLGSLLEDPVLTSVIDSDLRDRMISLKASIDSYIGCIENEGFAFSYDSLFKFSRGSDDDDLARLAEWSSTCDHEFAFVTIPIPPFANVRETMEGIADRADVWIISKTPYNDICNWLEAHDLTPYIDGVAGKEMGGKDEHICILKGGRFDPKSGKVIEHGSRYADHNVIMGGDGNGDMKAVRKNRGLFFGTPPGREAAIWGAAVEEVFEPFFAGSYRGGPEDANVTAFRNAMRPRGFWKNEDYKTFEDHVRCYAELDEVRIGLYEACKKGGKLLTASRLEQSY